MTELAKYFLANLGALGIVVVVGGWCIHWFLQKRLGPHFNSLERLNEFADEFRKSRLEQTSDFLRQIQKLASSCRSHLRMLIDSPNEKAVKAFCQSVDAFEDCLYAWQLFTSAPTYRLLHEYKRCLQPLATRLQMRATDDVAFTDEELLPYRRALEQIDLKYEPIQEAVRTEFDSLDIRAPSSK